MVIVGLALAVQSRAADPPLQALALQLVGPGQGVFVDADDGTVLVAEAADRPVRRPSRRSRRRWRSSRSSARRIAFETRVTAPARSRTDGSRATSSSTAATTRSSCSERVPRAGRSASSACRGRRRFARTARSSSTGSPTRPPRARRALRKDGAAPGTRSRPTSSSTTRAPPGRRPRDGDGDALVVTHSPDLVRVLKSCNGYSNNVLHYASDSIGGPHAVEAIARADARGAPRRDHDRQRCRRRHHEPHLPRAAVAILRKLETTTREDGPTITDILRSRASIPGAQGAAASTTAATSSARPRVRLGRASALVGLLRSPRYGTVAFAVLNAGVAVPKARAKQDAFVRALIDAVGAEPWPYETPMRPPYLLAKVE